MQPNNSVGETSDDDDSEISRQHDNGDPSCNSEIVDTLELASESEEEDESESEDCSESVSDSGNEDDEDEGDNVSDEDDESEVEEEEEEEEGSEEEGSEIDDQLPIKRSRRTIPDQIDSDSSDGQSDKCPICLSHFINQEIGSPESCDHTFCLECITEWSQNMNTCPADRRVFKLINVRKTLTGKITRQVSVQKQNATAQVEEDDPTNCQICGRSDREDRLLLCDGCDMGFHLECLNPPLANVPVEEWFCPACAVENHQDLAEEVDIEEGEALSLLDDDHPNIGLPLLRQRNATRMLPRTRQSEAVRRRILRTRATRQVDVDQPSTSSTDSPGEQTRRGVRITRPKITKTVKRRKTVRRRRKATKKRKTGTTRNRKSTSTGEPKKKKRRRYRRKKTKKTLRKVKIIPPATPQSRLAEQLGVKRMLPNHFLPVMQTPAGSRISHPRHSELVMPSLRLFGQRNELHTFSDDNDEGGETVVQRVVPALRNRARHGKSLSASALLSHRPVASMRRLVARISSQVPFSAPTESQPFDLLGSILSGQNMLTLTSKDITIKRDGSLRPTLVPGGSVGSARQRPTDPMQGTQSKSGGSQKESGSSNLPSRGNNDRASYSSHCSNATSEDQSGSYRYSDHHKSSGEDSGHASSNYGRTDASTANKKHEKRAEKEAKKQSEDEDIDIYSDIEPGFENEGDDNTLDQVGGLDDLGMADGNSPISDAMTDSQHNQVDGDCNDDVGNCSDAGSDDDLVIDESVKHEEDASNGEASEKNFETAAGDESEDNGLIIDEVEEAEEGSEDNVSERGPPSPVSPKHNMDVDDVSTYEDDSNKADDPASEEPYQAGGGDSGEIPEIESCSESEQAEKSEGDNFNSTTDLQQSMDNMNEESDNENQVGNAEDDEEDEEPEQEEVEDDEQEEQEDEQEEIEEERDLIQEEEQEEEEEVHAENECDKSNDGENAYDNESVGDAEEEEQNENAIEEAGEEEEEEEGDVDEEGGEEEPEHEDEKDSYQNEEEVDQSYDDENQNEGDETRSAGLEASIEGQESGAEGHESGAEEAMEHDDGESNVVEPEDNDENAAPVETDRNMTSEVSEGGMEGAEYEHAIASPNGGFLQPNAKADNNELPAEEGEIEEREKVRHHKLRNGANSGGFQEASSSSRRRSSPSHFRRRRGSKDYEEGEIVEDTPPRKSKGNRKSRASRNESPDYDTVPRINISELPRIPKIKRDKSGKDRTEACSVEGGNSLVMPGGNGGSAGSSANVNNSALETKRTSVMARLDTGSTTDICWKKLSQNTKTRNYRDGKPKGESKHFRQRDGRETKEASEKRSNSNSASSAPIISEELKKREAEAEKEKERKERERDMDYYTRNTEMKEYPRSKERSHDKRSSSKHEKEKHKDKHRDKHKSEKHKEYKEKHKHGGSGRPRDASLEKVKERGYEKYEKIITSEKLDKKEKKEQKREKMRKELERIHREEKHREHKKREKEKEKVMAITNLVLPSREASPIEMKEVYASGDSIIVNVNFSRPPGKENALKETKNKEEKTIKIKEKEHGEARERKKQRSIDGDGYPKEKVREKSSKRREMDDLKRDSKRQKYGHDDLRMTHREIIVKSRESRGWSQFREEPEDLPLLDNDQKSIASDASIVIADDSLNAVDLMTDSDDDVIEIEPGTGINPDSAPLESRYSDDVSQSPGATSGGGDDFCNYDSNSNDPIPCSPPSPAEENSVYDPFEPTKSPSPILSPEPSPPVPPGSGKAENPEPPPLPVLPPLPPEPEPDAPSPPSSSSEGASASSLLQTVPTSVAPSPVSLLLSVTPAPPTTASQSRPSPQSTAGITTASSSTTAPLALPVQTRPPPCMPPPISMPNIRVPPPNYIPRTMQPNAGPNTTQLSPLRPMGWSVGTANLLFPPSQQQIMRAAGNFLTPPPTLPGQGGSVNSQSVTLTQIGSLLHSQAAQLAMLSSVRPPPTGMPPHMGIPAILHPHGAMPQQFPQVASTTFSLTQNGETKRPPQQDTTEVVDMDVDSPYSPGDTLDPADSLPPAESQKEPLAHPALDSARARDRFDSLLGSVQSRKENVPAKTVDKGGHKGRGHSTGASKGAGRENRQRSEVQRKHIVRFEVPDRQAKVGMRGGKDKKVEEGKKEVTVKMDETQLKILDELPSSAVEMQVKEKFLKKLNRQERVIEEVKLAIKPYYNRREINKDEYKEILRKSVPKICHNKSGEINPVKIKALVEGYVKKFKYHRKRESKVGTSKKS